MLLGIVDRVTRRMRTAGRAGRTVTLRFRYDDFGRATRARSLAHPTAATNPIAAVATSILQSELDTIEQRGLTLIGLSVGNLMSLDGAAAMPEQMLLPFGRKDQSPLDTTLDSLPRALRTQRPDTGVVARAPRRLRDPQAARLTT